MASSLVTFAAEVQSQTTSPTLTVEPWVLGVLTFGVFVLLLLFTFAFRHTYHRHAVNKVNAQSPQHH